MAVFPLVIATLFNIIPLFIGENSVSSETYKYLSFISFLFIGLTGVVFFSCVTKFSSTWFSDGERATSTGLAFVMANLGNFVTYSGLSKVLSLLEACFDLISGSSLHMKIQIRYQ